ncbi:MAG TPA: hypothetical protein VGK67_21635 [Myxococcales bacterium]|jgi:hypothetical protein
MSAIASLLAALSLSAAPATQAAPPPAPSPADAIAAAHKAGERTHTLSAMSVESAIESLNSETITVFGTRRELRCPGGGQVTESACRPCKYKSVEWAERPEGQWMVDVSWPVADEAARAAAMAKLDHWRKYFDLEPRGGVEKGGKRFVLFELKGPKALVQEEPEITTVRIAVAGRESTLALVPAGQKDVELEAKTLGKAGSGALEPVEGGELQFEAVGGCADVIASGPRKAKVALRPKLEKCEVKASLVKGAASATIVVRRELALFVTVEGQRADSLVLEGANVIDLAFEVEPKAQTGKIAPEWSVEGGKLEVLEGGKNVRLRLEKGAAKARVELVDRESGAAAAAEVRRKGH